MSLSNYTGLKASIADFLNRDDLTAVIPDFITLDGVLRCYYILLYCAAKFVACYIRSSLELKTTTPLNGLA